MTSYNRSRTRRIVTLLPWCPLAAGPPGLVGYFYNQVSGDSGAGAVLGDFESRVAGAGPEAGWLFKVGDATWYFNLKGYYEFDARHRPEGWNAWLTLSVPVMQNGSDS